MILTGATLLGGDQVAEGGADWIRVEEGVIAELGRGRPPGPATDLGEGWLVPGFVDMHVHGGGGASFQTDDPVRAVAFHRVHGTTTLVASLVSGPVDELAAAVARLAPATADGLIVGVHLEGPWLAPSRAGAHAPAALVPPDPEMVLRLMRSGPVRIVTLAPELPGALDAVRALRAQGVVVAVGHTAATYEETRAAIAAGASVGTHLFNAMSPFHHREPGPSLALLEDPSVVVEVVADGVHLHPAVVRSVLAVAPGRVALVTDAVAAAGCTDGTYRLGDLEASVIDGVTRLVGTDTIAGSVLTMDAAVRNAVAGGTDLSVAIEAATATPARALALHDRGRLDVGQRADLVHLSPDLEGRRTWIAGTPV
jgi:N-acetylglucosamine-6-phosphate deacetylase